MSNFKGTKGTWDWYFDEYDSNYEVTGEKVVVKTISESSEDRYNALLISKAPEMLEMLKSCVLAFKQLGMQEPEGIKKLIKEATEL